MVTQGSRGMVMVLIDRHGLEYGYGRTMERRMENMGGGFAVYRQVSSLQFSLCILAAEEVVRLSDTAIGL